MTRPKNPAAVALGRLGGKAKVRKGIGAMSAERRAEISRKGVEARRKLSPDRQPPQEAS